MMRALLLAMAGLVSMGVLASRAEDAVLLHAAGSFRAALTEVARAFGGSGGTPVTAQFGASGLLRSLYGMIVGQGEADLFLTYCTSAKEAAAEVMGAQAIELPETIAVGADDGLTVMNGASERAYRLALFILAPEGQAILTRHGFAAPNAVQHGGSP
jgi:ABC-type molybdate transport system substrate-binding protein